VTVLENGELIGRAPVNMVVTPDNGGVMEPADIIAILLALVGVPCRFGGEKGK
jgi:hypothetical protein